MDIVYIVKKNDLNNFELRCSLRSIEKYGKGIKNVFVVGHCPDWLSDDVIKIPYEQPWKGENLTHFKKASNIASSILHVCQDERLGDHFLVSMDDHFYTNRVNFDNYPIHLKNYNRSFGGDKVYTELPKNVCDVNHMPATAAPRIATAYIDFLYHTRLILESHNLPCHNFTLHRNMHVWKTDILENYDLLSSWIENAECPEIFVWAGNYGLSKNRFKYEDCKTTFDNKILNIDPDHLELQWYKSSMYDVFSTCDFDRDSKIYEYLGIRYPKKCKYEK